jgi:hypothetical protein
VRRLFCFVLATLIAVWVPVQTAGIAGNRDTSFPIDGSAQTKGPSRSDAIDFGPCLIGGSGGSWQARHAHDAHASEICPTGLDVVHISVSKETGRLHLDVARPRRSFPLLI